MEVKSQEMDFQDKKALIAQELSIKHLTISMDSIFSQSLETNLLALHLILILTLSWQSPLQEQSMIFQSSTSLLEFFLLKFAQIVPLDQLLIIKNVLALAQQELIHSHILIKELHAEHAQVNLDLSFQMANVSREQSQLPLKLEPPL